MNMHMTYQQMSADWEAKTGHKWSPLTIMSHATSQGFHSDAQAYMQRTNNVMNNPENRKKVADTIAKMWEEGLYDGRINGMLGLTGENHPAYRPEGYSNNYREKAMFYHPEAVCVCCGKQLSWNDKSIEVHHVDEDHDNYTLTNLAPMCHSCHRKYHRKSQFTCYITKSFVFDACHYLPYHDKKCKFLHGHTYHMDVTVKNKVLQETGMVMDFGELKKIVEEEVIEKLDHGFINEYIDFPSCEMMIPWVWFRLSKRVKGLYSIKVWETDGSYCELTAPLLKDYLAHFECDWTKDSDKEESNESQ